MGAAPAGGPGGGLQREPVYNWQATKPTVQERFAFLFNNEVLSDVHFLVGKGRGTQRIPAHRWGGGRDVGRWGGGSHGLVVEVRAMGGRWRGWGEPCLGCDGEGKAVGGL